MRNALESTGNFTANEIDFIMLLFKNAESECGANNLKLLIADNFSWFAHSYFQSLYSKHEFAGFVSTLIKKGVVSDCGEGRVRLSLEETFLVEMLEKFGNLTW